MMKTHGPRPRPRVLMLLSPFLGGCGRMHSAAGAARRRRRLGRCGRRGCRLIRRLGSVAQRTPPGRSAGATARAPLALPAPNLLSRPSPADVPDTDGDAVTGLATALGCGQPPVVVEVAAAAPGHRVGRVPRTSAAAPVTLAEAACVGATAAIPLKNRRVIGSGDWERIGSGDWERQ